MCSSDRLSKGKKCEVCSNPNIKQLLVNVCSVNESMKSDFSSHKKCEAASLALDWERVVTTRWFVAQSLRRVWLCNPVDCSMPGSSVLHCLPKFVQIHVVKSMMPSIHLILGHPFFCLQSFPISWSFPMSSLFASGGLSFGQRASCVSWKQRPVFQATSSPKAHDLHKPSQAFCLIWIISWEIPDKKSWVLRMGRELRHLPM